MDGGAWWATVHGTAKSRTQLSDILTNTNVFVNCGTSGCELDRVPF